MNDKRNEDIKFWDRVAKVYTIFTNLINGRVHKKLKRLIESKIDAEDKVLECACGNGMLTKVIAKKCKEIVATDASSKMLNVAKRKLRHFHNIEWKQESILNISYADNTFDKVVAGNVIHLLDNPGDAVKELVRVCAPNGKVIIPTYMNKSVDESETFVKNLNSAGANFKQYFSADTYREFFIKEGYSNVEIEYIDGKIANAVAVFKKVE